MQDDKPKQDGNVKSFPFEVNGVELQAKFEKLVALDILTLAKDKDAFPGKPEDYILKGETRQYKPDDWVNLHEDKVFITIPQGSTEVA